MFHRIEVSLRPHLDDALGQKTTATILRALGLPVASVRLRSIYTVAGLDEAACARAIAGCALHDPVLQTASAAALSSDADWIVEVGFRPGVTDNAGRSARDTLALFLGCKDRDSLAAFAAVQYHILSEHASPLSHTDISRIAAEILANEHIQRARIKSRAEWEKEPGFPAQDCRVAGSAGDEVAVIPLASMSDERMLAFSRENTLALSLEELRAIRDHYSKAAVRADRAAAGLPQDATDAEMEMLAQTWSEHCKHKIFAALVSYEDKEAGTKETINSLFKTYIQGSTKKIREQLGSRDFCRSVFTDNAGIIAFTDTHDLAIKAETHNSPSALDPYGGALTGVLGVNRDVLGAGMGAAMVCNMDVACLASPLYAGELPPRLLHPRRMLEGVREGVEHGGNQSGVPTVNGSLVFDERFLGKPLVYCGTVGMLPRMVNGMPSHRKKAAAGDAIVMAGGRTGKDGIHGATFSSEELREDAPATAVQLGDSFTQRKLYDFLIQARDMGLYASVTDNGAGGLSSSVGEMAIGAGGCRLDLAKVPVKYEGLLPWEILLSEAQERMTLAVPQEKLQEFLGLAAAMEVEAACLGTFADSGYFEAFYNDIPVARLDMDFLHNGVPQMRLEAVWETPACAKPENGSSFDAPANGQGSFLRAMLGSLNICSKESVIRQYDHEAQGNSVIKPLVGALRDGPGDAAVLRPLPDSKEGMVLAHGICPKYSDYDTYWMMANAIDEAVRNAVAVGADPSRMAGVDNFCWCDPVQSERTPDGHYKMAQLVRANKALADFCLAYSLPCVSGKDSMKNDYTGGGVKISIPPTVLFTVLGHMPDVGCAISSDLKHAGDRIYLLGATGRDLAGSELARECGRNAHQAPRVDAASALTRYNSLYAAICRKLANACHDLSDGGLAVAIAEMAIGGRLGAKIDLALVPLVEPMNATELLYSESASRLLVSVPREKNAAFEALFAGQILAGIGVVTDDPRLVITRGGDTILAEAVDELASAFKATLRW